MNKLKNLINAFTDEFYTASKKGKQSIITEIQKRAETVENPEVKNILGNFSNALKAADNFPFPKTEKIVSFNTTGYKTFHLPFYDREASFFFLPKAIGGRIGAQFDVVACAVAFDASERVSPMLLRHKTKNAYTVARSGKEIYAKKSKVLERHFVRSVVSGKEIEPKDFYYVGSIVAIANLTVGSRNLIFKIQSIDGSYFY